jgi:Thioesterase-like superfamily
VSDSYYELLDAGDPLGERFTATDLVRSTWSAAIQHAAPVSALLVRGLERCEQRDDTRLSRVLVDLLWPVPAEGDLWVRTRLDRPGKQIELLTAEMLAPGPDGEPRPVARASGWRLQKLDTAEVVHAPAPPLRPVAEARSRDMKKDWDRNHVHSLDWRWLTKPMSEGPDGIGATIGTLFDESGAVGGIQQSVLVRARP